MLRAPTPILAPAQTRSREPYQEGWGLELELDGCGTATHIRAYTSHNPVERSLPW